MRSELEAVMQGKKSLSEVENKLGIVNKKNPRFKKINRNQTLLRVAIIEKFVEDDHEVRAIWELVGQQDLSRYNEDVRAIEGVAGRESLDPQMLISLWIYAYSQGVSSGREIARLITYHPGYQWLTGMQEINHHSLSDFRAKHQEALNKLFIDVLGVLSSEGMVTLDQVMHDGTKIKAYAGADSFRREKTLQKHWETAKKRVREMEDEKEGEASSSRIKAARQRVVREKQARLEESLKELEEIRAPKRSAEKKEEARASMSDPEARIMKHGTGGYAPGYNVQISTDQECKVIVGAEVSQAASDYDELIPAVDRIQENTGNFPGQMVADGGYTTRENIIAMAAKPIEFIGSLGDETGLAIGQFKRYGIQEEFYPEAFQYDEIKDEFICPLNKIVKYSHQEARPGMTRYVYRAARKDCQECEAKCKCCPKATNRGRAVGRCVEDPTVADFRLKMESELAKQTYKKRGEVAEFPNAWIKEKLRLRQFRLRGKEKVRMEVLWVCLTYNIQQWIRLRWRPRLALSASAA